MIFKYLFCTVLITASFFSKAELRWFDIELIFFERPVDNKLTEKLTNEELSVQDYASSEDIIAQAYQEISEYDYDSCLSLNPMLDNNDNVDSDNNNESQSPITKLEETNSQIEDSLIEESLSESSLNESDEIDNKFENELALPELTDVEYYCPFNKPINDFNELPLNPYSLSKQHTDNIYLLSADQLELNDIVERLKTKGLTPLLHTGWRQPESNISNLTPIYLYGGNNITAALLKEEEDRRLEQLFQDLNQFNEGYNLDITPVLDSVLDTDKSDELNVSPINLDQELETHSALEQDTLFAFTPAFNSDSVQMAIDNQTWQLQGIFKVFIRKNYLNIHADFDFNELSNASKLQFNQTDNDEVLIPLFEHQQELLTTHFSQFRRVISSQIHYFDHPRLGIVMQIRRYNH